jgi:hypothetical protein
MEKIKRKTRWAFHSFAIGDTKTFNAVDMPKFRSALSVWNKENPLSKISYDYENAGKNITVTRIA